MQIARTDKGNLRISSEAIAIRAAHGGIIATGVRLVPYSRSETHAPRAAESGRGKVAKGIS